ncbi:MAG: Uma2 family endonuclease [Bryobacterales bacterium]|nr:Uma2 family endonuclease [Bryobacterales bacterium]
MASSPTVPRLVTGLRMEREEFLRQWRQIPSLKNAELIDGTVYVASPVSAEHARYDALVQGWLFLYAANTPGVEHTVNGTWLTLSSAPQPDAALCIRPEHGGQSRMGGDFPVGAPELAVEICLASTEHDFGPKLALYQLAGVREYITIDLLGKQIVWRILNDGSYREISSVDGIVRSITFPGLWLDTPAFWRIDRPALISTLERGLSTSAHGAFARRLEAGKS